MITLLLVSKFSAKWCLRWALICVAWWASCAHAHEFWFAPIQSPQPVGAAVSLRLEVGEFFEGEAAGFSIPRAVAMRHFSGGVERDLRPYLSPDEPEAEVSIELASRGTHMVSFDSEAQTISLGADRFHAYLHDEGLDFVKARREASGTADQPGRERFWRHVKALVHAGPLSEKTMATDRTYATRVGQRLEILPLSNPLALRSGGNLRVRLEFESQPLAGALVKAWHHHRGQLVTMRTRTGDDGLAALNLPYAGGWMISVVHMVSTEGDPDIEWESHWGSLSFQVRAD